MHALRWKNFSRWYSLGLDSSGALVIRVSLPAWNEISPYLLATTPIIAAHATRLHLPFIAPTVTGWGFGPVVTCTETDESYISWRCPLSPSDPSQNVQKQLLCIVCTLSILFSVLDLYEPATPALTDRAQLVQVDILYMHDREMSKFPLCATLSSHAVSWLKDASKEARDSLANKMREAMQKTYALMMRRADDPRDRFLAHITNQLILLQVPGDACTLSGRLGEPGQGFPIDPHNVDTAAQQLTLLTALCTLSDELHALGL